MAVTRDRRTLLGRRGRHRGRCSRSMRTIHSLTGEWFLLHGWTVNDREDDAEWQMGVLHRARWVSD